MIAPVVVLLSLGVGHPSVAHDTTKAVSEVDQAQLAALMVHDFATTPDNTEQTIIDRRIEVTVQGESGVWFYSQLNTGDEFKLYRQRFHQLALSGDGKNLIQRSFVPVDPDRFVDLWTKAGLLTPISKSDMRPVLGEGCTQVWAKDAEGTWHGKVDPRTCEIFSERRQTNIRIGADSYYRGTVYGTSERGFDAEMNPIWGSKPGEYIPMLRCQSSRCEAEARALFNRTK
ncbi:MAG: chromophore lyase CpcT/CpeT [Erythrobacter sp.]|nr:chromophore lyase CpcT/CpeT [Erythrobacter sp.]